MKKIIYSLMVIIVAVFFVFSINSKSEFLFSSNKSPTHNYSVNIYGVNSLFSFWPINYRSDPGYVVLIDNRTGKELQREKMSSIRNDVTVIDWGNDRVSLRLFIEWKLPKSDAGLETQGVNISVIE